MREVKERRRWYEAHLPEPPGVVEHAGDTVKSEPVEAEVLEPHPEVGEEEAERLPGGVVEQPGVPQRVAAAVPRVEISRAAPVPHVQPVLHVLAEHSLWCQFKCRSGEND